MKRKTLYTIIALVIIIPIGFYTKFYHGTAAGWVNNSLSDVLYEIFWCLVLLLIFRELRPIHIALIVFFVTSFLEFTQLWKPDFLVTLRKNFIVKTLIGNCFIWSDFFYYAIGSILGFGSMMVISKMSKE